MRIEVTSNEIATALGRNGIEIAVDGFQGDTAAKPTQVFVEYYQGKLAVHVWDGSSEDCRTFIIPKQAQAVSR